MKNESTKNQKTRETMRDCKESIVRSFLSQLQSIETERNQKRERKKEKERVQITFSCFSFFSSFRSPCAAAFSWLCVATAVAVASLVASPSALCFGFTAGGGAFALGAFFSVVSSSFVCPGSTAVFFPGFWAVAGGALDAGLGLAAVGGGAVLDGLSVIAGLAAVVSSTSFGFVGFAAGGGGAAFFTLGLGGGAPGLGLGAGGGGMMMQ